MWLDDRCHDGVNKGYKGYNRGKLKKSIRTQDGTLNSLLEECNIFFYSYALNNTS